MRRCGGRSQAADNRPLRERSFKAEQSLLSVSIRVYPWLHTGPATMLKRTPLYAAHQKLSGRLIEFGGWEMPVQYSSIVDEHLAVRRAAGLFDISHMGEVLVSGTGALEFLNHPLPN